MSQIVIIAILLFLSLLAGATFTFLLLFNIVPALQARELAKEEPSADLEGKAPQAPYGDQEQMLEEWIYGIKS